ncbi:MAG: LysM peptidoglycan-binding domain-containing protein [Bacillales bacterium]|nr:LysM peptidoglycan-binding domain-containing protein [Bacillales bacterium]
MHIHVIQRGENLFAIARRYGVSIEDISLANQLGNPNQLVIGQSLVIPSPGREYVVKQGDQLWQIADRFGISEQALANYNQIANPTLLFAGQILLFPYTIYTVRLGDALSMIAARFGVTVRQILSANSLSNPNALRLGQRLIIPAVRRPVIEVNAYTSSTSESSRQEVLRLGKYFTYLSPFSHSVREDGTLSPLNDDRLLQAATANRTETLIVVTNFVNRRFNSDRAAAILRNPTLQETLITHILSAVRSKGYRGVHFDFEYLYPEDRENYNAFLRRVVSRLRPQGISVSTALAPKERENQPGLLYEAHDYRAHGEIVDFVILMTYEWGWAGGRPWAIAPINKIKQVLDYAITAIPRRKMMMGTPLYGRDWRIPWMEGTTARTISPKEAIQLAVRYRTNIDYSEAYQAPFFHYTDETGQRHEVWFEDARSMQAKMDIVKQYRLRGISYWVLGSPFPQNWAIQSRNFQTRKRM